MAVKAEENCSVEKLKAANSKLKSQKSKPGQILTFDFLIFTF